MKQYLPINDEFHVLTGRGLPERFASAEDAAKKAACYMRHCVLNEFLKLGVKCNQDRKLENWKMLVDALAIELAKPEPTEEHAGANEEADARIQHLKTAKLLG